MYNYYVVELLLIIYGSETTKKILIKSNNTHSAKISAITDEQHDEESAIDMETFTCEDTEYTIKVVKCEEVTDPTEIMCLSKWM